MNGKKVVWYLRLACFDLEEGYVGVYLILKQHPMLSVSDSEEFEVKCRFACLDDLRNEVHRKEGFMQFQKDKLCLGFREFVHHSHLLIPKSSLLIGNTFYLTCTLYSTQDPDEYYTDGWIHAVLGEEMSISTSIVCLDNLWILPPAISYYKNTEDTPTHSPLTIMLHHIYKLGLFADLKVTCGEKEFHLHKAILSAWSETFLAMFQSPMIEKEGQLSITDCSTRTFENLVKFMYSEQMPTHIRDVKDLLIVSDKYFIEPLKKICEEMLAETLSVANVTEITELALKYNCTRLKTNVINFIKDNREELSSDDKLKEVLLSDSDVLWNLSVLYRRDRSLEYKTTRG